MPAKKSKKKGAARRRSRPRNTVISVPLAKARGQLTELVDAADWRGTETVLTRNGKPVAKIVPVPGRKLGFQAALDRMEADKNEA